MSYISIKVLPKTGHGVKWNARYRILVCWWGWFSRGRS